MAESVSLLLEGSGTETKSAPPLFGRELSLVTRDKIVIPTLGRPDQVTRVVEGQIPADLKPALSIDFTEQEIFEIAHRCDVYSAATQNETPKALWIFGPPAVGKSTIADEKAADLVGDSSNAVTIDGDIFRTVHKGFQMVALHGSRNSMVHKDAWSILKKTGHMDNVKEGIVDHAVRNRQHLKIPEAAFNVKRIKGMMDKLEAAGYEMHALCLWAPKNVTEARGRPRSVKDGKVFSVDQYETVVGNMVKIAHDWEEEMNNNNESFAAISYYDNTIFPSHCVSAAEFDILASMSDEAAENHARQCDDTRRQREVVDYAESKARAQGLPARRILQVKIKTLMTLRAAGKASTPVTGKASTPVTPLVQESPSTKAESPAIKDVGTSSRSLSGHSMQTTLSQAAPRVESLLDDLLFVSEIRRSRLQGFAVGFAVGAVSVLLLAGKKLKRT